MIRGLAPQDQLFTVVFLLASWSSHTACLAGCITFFLFATVCLTVWCVYGNPPVGILCLHDKLHFLWSTWPSGIRLVPVLEALTGLIPLHAACLAVLVLLDNPVRSLEDKKVTRALIAYPSLQQLLLLFFLFFLGPLFRDSKRPCGGNSLSSFGPSCV